MPTGRNERTPMITALVVVACLSSITTDVIVLRAKGHLHPLQRLRRTGDKYQRPPSLTSLP